MTTISVAVPFFNSERYIERCIEALLGQDYPKEGYEIIFINNNSMDSSASIVKRHPSIKLIDEQKKGSYAARNRGLTEASGDIIAFTDSDCAPAADWLKNIETIMNDTRVGIAVGNYQSARHSYILSMMEDYENEKNNYIFTSGIKELFYGYTRNMAVRKRLFDEMGTFVERDRGSDVIFIRRCVDKYSCEITRYYPQMRVRHLEIDSFSKYFRKTFTYGKSSKEYSPVVNARALNNRERMQVFRRTVKNGRYSWVKTFSLLCLLTVAFVCWALGGVCSDLGIGRMHTRI